MVAAHDPTGGAHERLTGKNRHEDRGPLPEQGRSETERERAKMVRLLRFIAPYRAMLSLVLVLSFFSSLANLYLPKLMADIVDFGILNGDTGYIFEVGGIMLLIATAGTACAVAGSFLSARISTGFGRIIREKIFTPSKASPFTSSTPSEPPH